MIVNHMEERRKGPYFFILAFSLMLLSQAFYVPPSAEAETSEEAGALLSQGNRRILEGIYLIYDRRFDDAEALFKGYIADRPKDPAGHFYLAMITWSKLAAGFWSDVTVEEYKKRIDKVIEVARARVDNAGIDNKGADSYDFFYLGGALGFKGRFELMKGNWFSSFLLASDAIEALKTCREMAPDNKDVLLGIGTFDYYTARLSGVLKFLTYFLLHRGNKENGIRKLYEASEHATYSRTEAKSVLLHIQLFLEKNVSDALVLARELSDRYTENPRFKVLLGVCWIQMGKDRKVSETIDELLEKGRRASSVEKAGIWKRRALYLTSINDLMKGRYGKARSILEGILKDPDPVHDPAMIAWPLIKIGMSYDLAGKRDKAIGYYKRVFKMKNGAGAQFLAEKLLDGPIKPKDPFIGY